MTWTPGKNVAVVVPPPPPDPPGTTEWTPYVFTEKYNIHHWWDASDATRVVIDSVSGKTRSWQDKISSGEGTLASMASANAQPLAPSNGEIRFTVPNNRLEMKAQSRAGWENLWLHLIYRINWTLTGTSGTDGFLLAINGDAALAGRQIPAIKFHRLTHKLEVIWNSYDGIYSVQVDSPGDDVWHSLVTRRTEDGIWASIDGGAETTLACYPRNAVAADSGPIGWLGDHTATTAMNFGLSDVIIGAGHLDADDLDKMHAWALWRKGAQDNLDPGSSYLFDVPTIDSTDQRVPPEDSFAADGYIFGAFWDDTLRGQALNRTGFVSTFADDFTSLSTITDGFTGHGPWYAPALGYNASKAKMSRPTETPLVFSILPDNTTLQIWMRWDGVRFYKSGHIQTVDVWGEGTLFEHPPGGKRYFEARIAVNDTAMWPAFWIYGQVRHKDTSATYPEIDIIEMYGDNETSQRQLHHTLWAHPAPHPMPGNRGGIGPGGGGSRTPSKITNVNVAPWNDATIFDGTGNGQPGTFHTYGCLIDETWITMYYDDFLVTRYPTYSEALAPLYLLVSLQAEDGFPIVETFMWVDWVRAWSLTP